MKGFVNFLQTFRTKVAKIGYNLLKSGRLCFSGDPALGGTIENSILIDYDRLTDIDLFSTNRPNTNSIIPKCVSINHPSIKYVSIKNSIVKRSRALQLTRQVQQKLTLITLMLKTL